MDLKHEGAWLVADLGGPHQVASWALARGGLNQSTRVAWLQVSDEDLGPDIDAVQFLTDSLTRAGLEGAVCMLTASDLRHHQPSRREINGVSADVVATVGLSNRLAVGDPPTPDHIGTINILVVVSCSLSPSAMLEAMSIAVEARTAAMLSLEMQSGVTSHPATGTGTDCVVVAAPLENEIEPEHYAGKHTALGAAIGQAVLDAVTVGGKAWMERNL